jgi:LAO/AO transport system kinase
VPEAGDDIQTMKAGLMEIADIFVVNKADIPGAATTIKNLKMMMTSAFYKAKVEIPVIKTIASIKQGTDELLEKIDLGIKEQIRGEKKIMLLAEKAYLLIQEKKMQQVNKQELQEEIKKRSANATFNLYEFVKQKLSGNI